MTRRPLLLDLFCGAGGCAVGYHRAGFDVVGVDIKPQKNYPFPMVVADALQPPFDLSAFDAIHASPPCQAYSVLNAMNRMDYPDLVCATRTILAGSGRPYVIENVPGAPVDGAFFLCGSMFGLKTTTRLHGEVWLKRHRCFESNYLFLSPGGCRCNKRPKVPVYGNGAGGVKHAKMRGKGVALAARQVMGIDWMSRTELDQSIPPAYTEYIGRQLMRAIGQEKP